MLSKAIPLLCLLAAAAAQDGQNNADLASVIAQIFGSSPPTIPPSAVTTLPPIENKNPGPSTPVPGVVTPSPLAIEDFSCTTADGMAGECVPYYLCNDNNTVNLDETPVRDIRNRDGPCASYIDTCCLLPDKTDVPVAPKLKPEPEPKRDLEPVIAQVFGSSPPTIPPSVATTLPPIENKNPGPSTPVPGVVTPSPLAIEDFSCTTADGMAGECVPYYLCNDNNTVNLDETPVRDIRNRDGPCASYIDTCCLLPDKTDVPVAPKPKAELEPKHEGCGWRNPKGVGGVAWNDDELTKFGEFPWMCAVLKLAPYDSLLYGDVEPKLGTYLSGGSLIHPSVVLTTAHGVYGAPELRVRAGEWDTQTITEIYSHQDRDVDTIELHEDFNKDNQFYDISLLYLKEPMDLAPHIALACLPTPRERLHAGARCFATGWGKDKFGKEGRYQVILNKKELPVVDRTTCQNQLRKTRLGKLFELHTSFMCAGGEPGKDTCKGDGGSPLSCPIEGEDGRYMQSGIVSWSIGCGNEGTAGIYVDVSNLRNWVDDRMAAMGYDPKIYSF